MTAHPSTRPQLQQYLQDITGLPEDHVYFQPPDETKLKYPCIIYRLSDIDQIYADNDNYRNNHCYELTIISKNPDSKYVDTFARHKKCRFLRSFSEDTLNHWVFRFWTNL